MSYADFSNGCAWINGDYMPIDQAMIPITESGFTRSDVTYDVVAVWDGKFFRVDDHLDRFERAWKQLRMTPAISKGEIRNVLFNCVAKSGIQNASVGITVGGLIMAPAAGATLSTLSLPSGVYGVLMYLVIAPFLFWRRKNSVQE